jgi:hypothetical protein
VKPSLAQMWALTRQVVVFLLGCLVVIDGVTTQGTHVSELLVGVFMLGLVPVDALLTRLPWARRRDSDSDET